jgi:hypothetical protein
MSEWKVKPSAQRVGVLLACREGRREDEAGQCKRGQLGRTWPNSAGHWLSSASPDRSKLTKPRPALGLWCDGVFAEVHRASFPAAHSEKRGGSAARCDDVRRYAPTKTMFRSACHKSSPICRVEH